MVSIKVEVNTTTQAQSNAGHHSHVEVGAATCCCHRLQSTPSRHEIRCSICVRSNDLQWLDAEAAARSCTRATKFVTALTAPPQGGQAVEPESMSPDRGAAGRRRGRLQAKPRVDHFREPEFRNCFNLPLRPGRNLGYSYTEAPHKIRGLLPCSSSIRSRHSQPRWCAMAASAGSPMTATARPADSSI